MWGKIETRAGEPAPEPVGAGCFWLLVAGAAWKKKPGAGAAWKKKSGAGAGAGAGAGSGAVTKLAGSSALLEDRKHKEIVL